MKPAEKLPETFEWKFADGSSMIVTRDELALGFKIGDIGIRELMRDKGRLKK